MARFRRKSCLALLALASVIFIIIVILKSSSEQALDLPDALGPELFPHASRQEKPVKQLRTDRPTPDADTKEVNNMNQETLLEKYPPPNYNVHAFYYTWYGNPQFDGKYLHWDHPLLPHWDPKVAAAFPTGRHSPPDDIGANFYPSLGAYSSRDPSVIDAHMRQMRVAAIGVLAISWYPPGLKDDNGDITDGIVPLVLDTAHKYQIKVTFHIEPFKGRDERTMFESVKYIVEKYGEHPAFFRYKTKTGRTLPLYYVYDSYLLSPENWALFLKPNGKNSVRNTPYDGIFLGLMVEEKHKRSISSSGFDGMYTYFATNGFTYGSSYRNWRSIKAFCDANDLIFIPSVGPGYIDTSIRPWNSQNTRNRIKGRYYETALGAAVDAGARVVSITSFNEWHEGTQIEMAVPKSGGTAYLDYLPHKPGIYLQITRKWADKFSDE
ncbi:glycoprotein endo-alpha-1,2-mannosidase [Sardina pilchardus]|uniref:glycoprotein endo-alpha-1,2-mannosidase n=1 Tax=Sardina pilchardus TaxID=27697 RepID=UPI002E15B85F